MKRWVSLFFLVTLACVTPSLTLDTQTLELTKTETRAVTQSPTVEVLPTFTPTPIPVVEPQPTRILYPTLDDSTITLYPSDLFPNDYLSIDIVPLIPPDSTEPLTLTVSFADGSTNIRAVEPTGLDDLKRARFVWVNQIPEIESPLPLTFTLEYPVGLLPNDTEIITLTTQTEISPIERLAPPEPDARWAITRTAGFKIHYITGTKAERELDFIMSEVNQTNTVISQYLGNSRGSIDIYILDRVIGQGGYASTDWVAISYTDRGYSPIGLGSLLRHELTHRLDSAIGCSNAPAFIREGLAVFLAGGHYREESIVTKASVAKSSGYMIPYVQLVEDFYLQQHEIAYLEAAAFISYFDNQYGWDTIKQLCKLSSSTEGNDLEKLDSATRQLINMDLSRAFTHYRDWLSNQSVNPLDRELFDLELLMMELMRQYQLLYDPSAHFLQGILFDPKEGEQLEIVADFVRGPLENEAVAIELLLSASQDAVVRQDVQFLKTVLSMLKSILSEGGTEIDVYREVVQLVDYVIGLGFEPFTLAFLGSNNYEVSVLNQALWPQTLVLQIAWNNERWIITDVQE